jgi:hypothetical protein
VVPFLTGEAEGFDINTQPDWDYAEAMMRQGKYKPPKITEAPFVGAMLSEGRVG